MEGAVIEELFIEDFGQEEYEKIQEFIFNNCLLSIYEKSRESSETLFYFGLDYGLLSLVIFCYCRLNIEIDIDESITRCTRCTRCTHGTRCQNNHSDKTITNRIIQFLERIKRYSQCKIIRKDNKCHFLYSIVPKYLHQYKLLDFYI